MNEVKVASISKELSFQSASTLELLELLELLEILELFHRSTSRSSKAFQLTFEHRTSVDFYEFYGLSLAHLCKFYATFPVPDL